MTLRGMCSWDGCWRLQDVQLLYSVLYSFNHHSHTLCHGAGFVRMASAARTMTGLALKPFSFALAPLIRLARDGRPVEQPPLRFVPKQLTSLQADFPFSEFLEVRQGQDRVLSASVGFCV